MREILFKAKRVENGEWVEGNLLEFKGEYYISPIPYQCMKGYSSKDGEEYGFGGFEKVDDSTICQYTGLTDKNGRKIWENDTVEISLENGYFSVEWSDTEARWQMNNEEDRIMVDFDNYWPYQVEVIGNVFDNPELLESEVSGNEYDGTEHDCSD